MWVPYDLRGGLGNLDVCLPLGFRRHDQAVMGLSSACCRICPHGLMQFPHLEFYFLPTESKQITCSSVPTRTFQFLHPVVHCTLVSMAAGFLVWLICPSTYRALLPASVRCEPCSGGDEWSNPPPERPPFFIQLMFSDPSMITAFVVAIRKICPFTQLYMFLHKGTQKVTGFRKDTTS